MKKTTITAIGSLLAAISMSAAAVLPASAHDLTTGVNLDINSHDSANHDGNSTLGINTKVDGHLNLGNSQAKADEAITARINALNALQTRVNAMVKLSSGQKATISASIQSALQSMTALKTKIDADTDAATLKIDIQSITKDNRIYALIIPQARIDASADREETVISLMNTLATKLQARITAAQAAGKDVTAMQSAFADFQAKVSDANIQAQAAIALVANLQPDQGNQTILQSNNAALKQAIADIKVGESDLKAARKDAQSIAVKVRTHDTAKVSGSSQDHSASSNSENK